MTPAPEPPIPEDVLERARGAVPCSGLTRDVPGDYPNQPLGFGYDERCGDDSPSFVCDLHHAIGRALLAYGDEKLEEARQVCIRQAEFWHKRSGNPEGKLDPDAAAAHILAGRIHALKASPR